MNAAEWEEIKTIFAAASELPSGERAAYLNSCDKNLRGEVEKLLEANDEAGDFISDAAIVDVGLNEDEQPDAFAGKQIDSYKLIKEIGHGGMGTVYLAERADESFDRLVAVKLIKRGMDTNAVLKRFVMERQILANLEHPNIAGLLDGGSTEDGLPYLVMEYVEGLPVTKFCDLRKLDTNERLELFRKICAAVSYAHTNLVVHRDLKPSNILVTEDGTPKLLDFGIAKLLHPEWSLDTEEATATMFRVMTPEYASPEQIRGQPVTTASDVYSLGVVLYELLTGARPYKLESRSPGEVAQIVLTAEPIRPSSVVSNSIDIANSQTKENEATNTSSFRVSNSALRNLKGDLDNIILKALRKEPERRYATVQEFSEDIRRHLEGLPVTATADTTAYRLNKFVKRHRAGVLASLLITLTLIAATAVTAWQAVAARRERDKAERRFNDVRKLTQTILFAYYDQIIKLPGSTPLLERMVKDTVEYLDNIAAESGGDPGLQSEIATAYQKVGDVQGNPYQGNLGNIEAAMASYQKSLAIREKLSYDNPADAGMQRDLAKSYESNGDMQWTIGEYAQSHENYHKSLQIHLRLADAEAENVEEMYEVARARHRIGQALSRIGDLDGAMESFQLGLTRYREVVAAAPEVPKYRRGLGSALIKIGDMAAAKYDWRTAIKNHRGALEIWSSLSAAEPLKANLKRDVALAADRLAVDQKELSLLPDALKNARRSVEIQQEISAADPKNVQFAGELGLYYVHLGNVQSKLRDGSAALENVRNGLKILQQFADASPKAMDLRRDLALSYKSAGDVFNDNAKYDEASESYRRSAELLEIAALRTELRETLAQDYNSIGEIHRKAGRLREADEWFRKGQAVLSEL